MLQRSFADRLDIGPAVDAADVDALLDGGNKDLCT